MKYSVIIPIYKTENTLKRCLDSLLDQPHEDVELILVNDGSPDGSGSLCHDYVQRHSCIRYYETENNGVAAARNLGLDHATGEYIVFVDSDDYVEPGYFSALNEHLDPEYDLLMFGRYVLDKTGKKADPLHSANARSKEETAILLSEALRQQLMNSCWNKVYRRSVIEKYGIRFDNRLPIGEDKVFAVLYATYCTNAQFIEDCLYTVSVDNPESLSRKQRQDLCEYVLLEHDLLFEAADKSQFPEVYRKSVSYSFYRSAYTVIRRLYQLDLLPKQRKEEIRKICSRYAQKNICSYYDLKHRIIAALILKKRVRLIDFLLRVKRTV